MIRKKNKNKLFLIITILFISIGFAFLTSTFGIEGITNIGGKRWSIYFNNIDKVSGESFEVVSPTASGTDTTSIDYTVKLLEPGDVYNFNIDIVNDGNIDARIKVITDSGLTEEQAKYLSYYITYSDGTSVDDYHYLAQNSTETLSVYVSFKDDITESDLPEEDQSVTIKFHVEYEQSDEEFERNKIVVVNRADESKLSIGDELSLGTEYFYVLATDETKTTLIAKNNLNVSLDINSIVQNTDQSMSPVAFSTINYWHDTTNNTILEKYGMAYGYNSIYDEEYNTADGDTYSVAYYVKAYENTLKNMNMIIQKTRLLTIEDIEDFGCTPYDYGYDYDCTGISEDKYFLFRTDTWMGNASAANYVYRLKNTKNIYNNFNYSYDQYGSYGVRPVIEIPPLEI